MNLQSLLTAFEKFHETLDATTLAAHGGDRQIPGIAHAVALSEASQQLFRELAAAHTALSRQHGATMPDLPPGVVVMESDSPNGPWSPVGLEHLSIEAYSIGGQGADAVLVAALAGAAEVAAFPAAKWNAMQAKHPGGNHQRWHVGDIISAAQLNVLESTAKLLRLAMKDKPPVRTVDLVHGDSVQRLMAAFEALHCRVHPHSLRITRTPGTSEVTLPDDAQFRSLAIEGGRVLEKLPEHWRFGIQARVMTESEPAKRWVNALFDLAVEGFLRVPNWDDAHRVECITEAARASQSACDLLLANARRPHRGKGNLASKLEAARVRADEIEQLAGRSPLPEMAKVYSLTCEAFNAACAIARISRNPDYLSASRFVEDQTRLEECTERAEAIVQRPEVSAWPTSPGTIFSWKAGDSALEVALSFSRAITSASAYARTLSVGMIGHEPPDLRVDEPEPDQEIRDWHTATVKELQEHTLQSLPAWPVWEIMRDEQRMGSLLRDEARRAGIFLEKTIHSNEILPVTVPPVLQDASNWDGANSSGTPRRFKVAFSFPGEGREYVKEVDRFVSKILGRGCRFL